MGAYLLGVRTDTYDLDTRLRAALEAHLAEGIPANNNYSLRLSDPADGVASKLKALYRGASLETASRSARRVVEALLTGLSTWALRERDDLTEVEAVAAAGCGRAVLLPASMACHSPALERRLAGAGIGLVDAPVAHLDARTGEVVIPPLQLEVDWEPLAALLDDTGRPAREGPAVEPGRYPLAARIGDSEAGPVQLAGAAIKALTE